MPSIFRSNKKNKPTFQRQSVSKKKESYEPSYELIGVVFLLLIAGLLMIFSASAVIAFLYRSDTFFYFGRQLIWIAVGTVAAFVLYKIDIQTLRKFALPLMIVSIGMLIYLLPEALSPFADASHTMKAIEFPLVETRNGATRWIDFGFFDIQPSELIKFSLIIFTCTWLTLNNESKKLIEKWIRSFEKNNEFLYTLYWGIYKFFPVVILGISSFLVFLQKELDSIAIILLIFLSIYYVGATESYQRVTTYLIALASPVVGTLAILIEPYRRSRLNAFMQILVNGEPSEASKRLESFQIWNGLIAIGSGALFGVGYGNSRLKLFFLQEAAYTDSIFAILAEEFGFVGTVAVIMAFVYILSLGLKIARDAEDQYSALLAVGCTSWITLQAFLNIAANLAIIPFGGMPLPFFTYGGSNTITIMMAVGILLNISKKKKLQTVNVDRL